MSDLPFPLLDGLDSGQMALCSAPTGHRIAAMPQKRPQRLRATFGAPKHRALANGGTRGELKTQGPSL
jgi:hypothetical protein